MDVLAPTLLRIYELTVFFVIALLVATLPFFTILVSYSQRLIQRITAEYTRQKDEARSRADKEREKIAAVDDVPVLPPDEKALADNWIKALDELDEKEKEIKTRLSSFSFPAIFFEPGKLLLLSLFSLFITIILVGICSEVLCLLLSLQIYCFSWLFIILALSEHIIPRLKDIYELAAEHTETPFETVQRILREQMEHGKKEQQRLFQDLIHKLTEVTQGLDRLYLLKDADYEVGFVEGTEISDHLDLRIGQEKSCIFYIGNNSPFSVIDAIIELALPREFTLRKSLDEKSNKRPSNAKFYPEGPHLRFKFERFGSGSARNRPFYIKANQIGSFRLFVGVSSTSHKHTRYHFTVNVE